MQFFDPLVDLSTILAFDRHDILFCLFDNADEAIDDTDDVLLVLLVLLSGFFDSLNDCQCAIAPSHIIINNGAHTRGK